MNDLMPPAPSRQQDGEGPPQPAIPVASPAVLDYARFPKRSLPKWLTRPLTPGTAAVIWILSSIALNFFDERIVYPHLAIGLALCTIAAILGWRAGLVWKLQVLFAMALLAVGVDLFVAPWRMWGYSPSYWTIYNLSLIHI